jgi:hypothetical protein
MSKPVRRFDVCAGRPYTSNGEEKKHWINVGRMTEWDDGSFSIELHAVPVGDWFDGRLQAFEPKPKEGEQQAQRPARGGQQQRPQRQAAPAGEFADDDIPFDGGR